MPFKKGQSGNPATQFKPGNPGGGRPKTRLLAEAYRRALQEVDPKKKRTIVEMITRALVAKALRGDIRAIQELADRTEGKPRQAVDVEGDVSYVESLSDEELAQAIQERLERIQKACEGGSRPRSLQRKD